MSAHWLTKPVITSAYAWRIERCDGVTLGFVSHDRDLVIDDLLHRASPGMKPSTIALSDTLDIDNAEVEGVMSADAFTDDDLAAGRWNGARLTISLIDWERPNQAAVHLITGEFGEITRYGDAFRVEILGGASVLDGPLNQVTSPTCRAVFGDKLCKISLARHQVEAVVTASSGQMIEFAGLAGSAANYGFGQLRWQDGRKCGLSQTIARGEGDKLWLVDDPVGAVQAGDRALLTVGCDKNFSTCRDRFGNSINFRGEPHLPGNDLLTRYPGA